MKTKMQEWRYWAGAMGLLVGMVSLGSEAGQLPLPFATDDGSSKLWILVVAGIAVAGVIVWRVGGEVLTALVSGRGRDLRVYERLPMAEEVFESRRALDEIVTDTAERLTGLGFVTRAPTPVGQGIRMEAEKAKTPASTGMLIDPMEAAIELTPVEGGTSVRAQMRLRTTVFGDVANDRRKLRNVARYLTGENQELAAIRRPPVALDMAAITNGLMLLLLAAGWTHGRWEHMGEAAQLIAAVNVLLGVLQIVRNRQTTQGMAAAMPLGAAAVWPAMAHGLLAWRPSLLEGGERWCYVLMVLAGTWLVARWWNGRMAASSPVYIVPEAKLATGMGWGGRSLLLGALFGSLLAAIGAWLLVSTLWMSEREIISVDDLAVGHGAKGQWVNLRGNADWGNVVWVKSGSSRDYYVPLWPVKGKREKVLAVVELSEKRMVGEVARRIEEAGADGIIRAGGLPDAARLELEKEGLEVAEDVLVVMDARMPGDVRGEGWMATAAGVVVTAGCAMMGIGMRRRARRGWQATASQVP